MGFWDWILFLLWTPIEGFLETLEEPPKWTCKWAGVTPMVWFDTYPILINQSKKKREGPEGQFLGRLWEQPTSFDGLGFHTHEGQWVSLSWKKHMLLLGNATNSSCLLTHTTLEHTFARLTLWKIHFCTLVESFYMLTGQNTRFMWWYCSWIVRLLWQRLETLEGKITPH